MFNHQHPDELVTEILSQIAIENGKTLERIKRLLLIKQNQAINRRFWQILDALYLTIPTLTSAVAQDAVL